MRISNLSSQILNSRFPLLLVLIPFAVLGIIYSLVTPPLEASDEFKHYPFTQYVQTERDLPVLDLELCIGNPPSDDCPWLQDGGQPPLYYMVTALLTSWIDTDDLPQLRWMNWHAFIGDPSQVGNKNLIVHQPEREAFPWSGSVLAIHLIRFFSVGIGLVTVTLTYQVCLELFPPGSTGSPQGRRALALSAAALTAFTPMFLFVSGSVNNDTFSAMMGNLALLLLIRLAKKWIRVGESGERQPVRIADALPLGLAVGLYLLGKLSALGFLGLTGAVLIWVSWRRRDWRPLFVGGGTVGAAAALIAGWWFVRNYNLYGDLTALNYFVEIQGWRASPLTWGDLIDEFGTFRWTYWGLFGAVDVMAPRWVYTFFDLLSLVGLGGLILRAGRAYRPGVPLRRQLEAALDRLRWIPALWALILFVSLIRWTLIFYSFQGRLMFPGIAGISTLLLVGLGQWAPARYRNWVGAGVGLVAFGIAAMIPFVSILPAYQQPEPLTLDQVPPSASRPPIDFEHPESGQPVVRLLGWEVPQGQVVEPGQGVEVTLYWQSLAPIDEDLVSAVKLLGRGLEVVGQVNRYPGMGMVPTSLWQPGEIWRDVYQVRPAGGQGPARLQVAVALRDKGRRQDLIPVSPAGDELALLVVGQAKLKGEPQKVEPAIRLETAFAEGIRLLGADLDQTRVAPGERLALTLYWRAEGTPSRDYTVFVHLVGAEPQALAQADGPPVHGDYPTSLWAQGETIIDRRELLVPADLPPGEYHINVGLYWDEGRLPLLDETGAVVGDYVQAATVEVVRE